MKETALDRVGKVTLTAGVLFAIFAAFVYMQYLRSPRGQAERYVVEQERLYREDQYGGSTPEETLALFIAALKAGDVDLASKYFVLENQSKTIVYLAQLKDKDLISRMIDELKKSVLTLRDNTAFLSFQNKNGKTESEFILKKNFLNNKWKITEL